MIGKYAGRLAIRLRFISGLLLLLPLLFCSHEQPEPVVQGSSYYVAPVTADPPGNDFNPGTIEAPWATFEKAFHTAGPGDIVYFRGGVYYPRKKITYAPATNVQGKDGTRSNPIRYVNYPEEKPVLDFIRAIPESNISTGIRFDDVDFVHVKGITIQNVRQTEPEDVVEAWDIANHSGNVIFENCVVHHVGGIGFQVQHPDTVYFINCDAYNCSDSLQIPLPGNFGSGFSVHNDVERDSYVSYYGCRAWNCGDQGFYSGSVSLTTYDHCWSFNNGQLLGGGHGFKLGYTPDILTIDPQRIVIHCLAAFNRVTGFDTNDNGHYCQAMIVYNNTAYHNGFEDYEGGGHGFRILVPVNLAHRIYRNNLSYGNELGDLFKSEYQHENNSWDLAGSITVTGQDFLSLDSTGLSGPRQADGSLPYLNFLKLAPGSDLIDAGTTATHLPYSGSAPDLGAFESTVL